MTEKTRTPPLYWLPPPESGAGTVELPDDGAEAFERLRAAADRALDFMQTRRLARLLEANRDRLPKDTPRLRLAIAGSSTLDHLVPGIVAGALRRGLVADVMVCPYGQWRQQVLDPESALRAFDPDAVLIAVETEALIPPLAPDTPAEDVARLVDGAVSELGRLWAMIRDEMKAVPIQQTPWFSAPAVYGSFERLIPAAPGAVAAALDHALVAAARESGALLFDMHAATGEVGRTAITDPMLWHHGKQALSPAAVPWAGDRLARILAAMRGLSRKVLVLDLDNTLWGGTIGDDGIDGIVLGQGSAAGEAYVAFQHYVRRLAERGIVIAVSSKNDEAVAREAIDTHPEMVLRGGDFAAFEVSWGDKPAAIRRIAAGLELGLDSFVFVDDNPVERALMRETLPQVAVPELPEAPERYSNCIADAGYFEAVSFTPEDTQRNAQYAANRARNDLRETATDIEGFLEALDTRMTVSPFLAPDIGRITQLINKTNQFNLTTRRYTEAEVRAMIDDPDVLTFAARVSDRFGDNGMTSIVICRPAEETRPALEIDTWLMSCRILGRGVERAMLSVVAEKAGESGAEILIGRYRPTNKNAMVTKLLPELGFEPAESHEDEGGGTNWVLPLGADAVTVPAHLQVSYRSK